MRIIDILDLFLAFILTSIELSSPFDSLPDGTPTNYESFYGGPHPSARQYFPAKEDSPARIPASMTDSYVSFGSPGRPSSSGEPPSQPLLTKVRKKFVFSTPNKPLVIKTARNIYEPIIPLIEEYTVLTSNDLVLGILDKQFIRRGLYNRSQRRVKFNMVTGQVNDITEEEKALCPIGYKLRLNPSDFIVGPRNALPPWH